MSQIDEPSDIVDEFVLGMFSTNYEEDADNHSGEAAMGARTLALSVDRQSPFGVLHQLLTPGSSKETTIAAIKALFEGDELYAKADYQINPSKGKRSRAKMPEVLNSHGSSSNGKKISVLHYRTDFVEHIPRIYETMEEWDTKPFADICQGIGKQINWETVHSKSPLQSSLFHAACALIHFSKNGCRNPNYGSITFEDFETKYCDLLNLMDEDKSKWVPERLYHFRNVMCMCRGFIKIWGLIIDVIPRLSEGKKRTSGGQAHFIVRCYQAIFDVEMLNLPVSDAIGRLSKTSQRLVSPKGAAVQSSDEVQNGSFERKFRMDIRREGKNAGTADIRFVHNEEFGWSAHHVSILRGDRLLATHIGRFQSSRHINKSINNSTLHQFLFRWMETDRPGFTLLTGLCESEKVSYFVEEDEEVESDDSALVRYVENILCDSGSPLDLEAHRRVVQQMAQGSSSSSSTAGAGSSSAAVTLPCVLHTDRVTSQGFDSSSSSDWCSNNLAPTCQLPVSLGDTPGEDSCGINCGINLQYPEFTHAEMNKGLNAETKSMPSSTLLAADASSKSKSRLRSDLSSANSEGAPGSQKPCHFNPDKHDGIEVAGNEHAFSSDATNSFDAPDFSEEAFPFNSGVVTLAANSITSGGAAAPMSQGDSAPPDLLNIVSGSMGSLDEGCTNNARSPDSEHGPPLLEQTSFVSKPSRFVDWDKEVDNHQRCAP